MWNSGLNIRRLLICMPVLGCSGQNRRSIGTIKFWSGQISCDRDKKFMSERPNSEFQIRRATG